ncbi:hypothetical protein A7982_12189 [Minicystis rosea]|nr:hypothetical protein A7982_12189 [Minicystis rosea]
MKHWLAVVLLLLGSPLLAPGCGSGDDRCKGDGEVFAEPPGCGDGTHDLAVAGCYVACTKVGEACGNGKTCQVVQVNPCDCTSEGGEGCCDACAGDELLCL